MTICLIFALSIKSIDGVLYKILWGDEIAKAWQTCPLVSGVGITG